MWKVKNKSDASNKRGKCDLSKVIYKMSERHYRKAHHGTVENSRSEHCTVPNVLSWEITLHHKLYLLNSCTVYSSNVVYFGYIIVNSLYKSDKMLINRAH